MGVSCIHSTVPFLSKTSFAIQAFVFDFQMTGRNDFVIPFNGLEFTYKQRRFKILFGTLDSGALLSSLLITCLGLILIDFKYLLNYTVISISQHLAFLKNLHSSF